MNPIERALAQADDIVAANRHLEAVTEQHQHRTNAEDHPVYSAIAAQLGVPAPDVAAVDRLRRTSRPILIHRATEIEAALKEASHDD